MVYIYEPAGELIIWIGSDYSNEKLCSKWVEEILMSYHTKSSDTKDWDRIGGVSRQQRDCMFEDLHLDADDTLGALMQGRTKKWLADRQQCTLINNLYWTRAWIVQEVLLSSERTVWYDRLMIEWTDFIELCELAERTFSVRAGELCPRVHLHALMKDCVRRLRSPFLDPKDVADHYGRSNCSDLRDLCYAWQGLVEPQFRCNPSYSASLGEVFVAMAVKVASSPPTWFSGPWSSCKQIADRMSLRSQRVILPKPMKILFPASRLTSAKKVLREVVENFPINPRRDRYEKMMKVEIWHKPILDNEMKKADRVFMNLVRTSMGAEESLEVLKETYEAILLGIKPRRYHDIIGETVEITQQDLAIIQVVLEERAQRGDFRNEWHKKS